MTALPNVERHQVPAASPDEPVIYIKDLPEWARPAFPNTEKLNRVQSVLYKSGPYGDDGRGREWGRGLGGGGRMRVGGWVGGWGWGGVGSSWRMLPSDRLPRSQS